MPRTVYRVDPQIAAQLVEHCVYVEQGKSSKVGARPINSAMGKLLWAIQACYAEIENEEKAEAVRAGQLRAKAQGKHVGRPRLIFRREEAVRLRRAGESWSKIAAALGVSVGSVRRAYRVLTGSPTACQKSQGEAA